jgi:hypothetical protein
VKDQSTSPKSSLQTKQVWKEKVASSSKSPSQEVQPLRPPSPRLVDALEEQIRLEKVLFGRLKTLNPRREVKSVVIHIYPFAMHKLFSL